MWRACWGDQWQVTDSHSSLWLFCGTWKRQQEEKAWESSALQPIARGPSSPPPPPSPLTSWMSSDAEPLSPMTNCPPFPTFPTPSTLPLSQLPTPVDVLLRLLVLPEYYADDTLKVMACYKVVRGGFQTVSYTFSSSCGKSWTQNKGWSLIKTNEGYY